MNPLSEGLAYIDVRFLGVPRVIAAAVVHGPSGVALIDPGPSSTLPTLLAELKKAGIAAGDLTALVLTHIHLDHAGSSGTLVRANPQLRVFVHEKGAPHMIDPARLLASAARLYGDDMDRLWGEFLPVPARSVVALAGGERIDVASRTLDVAYTPGHASHHVSYFDAGTGLAFVGDTAGIRLTPHGYVLPPTPPPDIDLEAWPRSLDRIGQWRPDTLFLTHFGPCSPVAAHLAELGDHMERASRLARASLAREGTDADREGWFIEEIRRELRRTTSDAEAHVYEVAGRFDLNWRGLARYWRKRLERG